MQEIWKHIPNGNYLVSNLGRIKRIKSTKGHPAGEILKPYLNKKRGYMYRSMVENGKLKNRLLHRIVAENFIGPCLEGYQVNHKNGIKTDNRAENLEYMTPIQNIHHSIDNGTTNNFGERGGFSKLKNWQVLSIRELHNNGLTGAKISRMYSVTPATISRIVNLKIWRHLIKAE